MDHHESQLLIFWVGESPCTFRGRTASRADSDSKTTSSVKESTQTLREITENHGDCGDSESSVTKINASDDTIFDLLFCSSGEERGMKPLN